ncbi:MAG: hypothetical protein CML81_02415 [Rhodobiaceae bacterium]|nr:hypothetical protein [Rhodobiaceae bacterium]RPF97251.1 MAG: hypothetical protein CBD87_002405 [Rhizobiales bacterium TMED227]|tara:strand:+ start:290 stop:478 length:189 start_codon:yes stop_codon:yes gene_type:complete
MGINSSHNKETDLQVGPTSEGMVRIFIRNDEVSLPLDFSPDDAIEIANEIIASAKILTKTKK